MDFKDFFSIRSVIFSGCQEFWMASIHIYIYTYIYIYIRIYIYIYVYIYIYWIYIYIYMYVYHIMNVGCISACLDISYDLIFSR